MNEQRYVEALIERHRRECADLERGLFTNDDKAIHAFRLACKRFRFAIERFEVEALAPAAEALAKITDELGASHDCAVLEKRARKLGADAVAWRALVDRSGHLKRGRALWLELVPSLQRDTA